jgi:hypothetical protein
MVVHVFSDEPLQVGEMYCIGITGRTDVTDWSGALRLGLTTEVMTASFAFFTASKNRTLCFHVVSGL